MTSIAHSRTRAALTILIAVCCSPTSALAQEYPITGVWVADDGHTPGNKGGACFTLKLLGVDAAIDGSLPAVLIFGDGRRVELHAGYRSDVIVKSVRSLTDDAFRIAEMPSKRSKWFPWARRQSRSLKVVDPVTIEFSDGATTTRFLKCSSKSSIL